MGWDLKTITSSHNHITDTTDAVQTQLLQSLGGPHMIFDTKTYVLTLLPGVDSPVSWLSLFWKSKASLGPQPWQRRSIHPTDRRLTVLPCTLPCFVKTVIDVRYKLTKTHQPPNLDLEHLWLSVELPLRQFCVFEFGIEDGRAKCFWQPVDWTYLFATNERQSLTLTVNEAHALHYKWMRVMFYT